MSKEDDDLLNFFDNLDDGDDEEEVKPQKESKKSKKVEKEEDTSSFDFDDDNLEFNDEDDNIDFDDEEEQEDWWDDLDFDDENEEQNESESDDELDDLDFDDEDNNEEEQNESEEQEENESYWWWFFDEDEEEWNESESDEDDDLNFDDDEDTEEQEDWDDLDFEDEEWEEQEDEEWWEFEYDEEEQDEWEEQEDEDNWRWFFDDDNEEQEDEWNNDFFWNDDNDEEEQEDDNHYDKWEWFMTKIWFWKHNWWWLSDDARRNSDWSSFNPKNPEFNWWKKINDRVHVDTNKLIIMEKQNVWKYNLFARIFNSLSRERWEIFSKQKIQSDDYKNLRLENFREIDVTMKKYPHSMYIDLSWLNLYDITKEVNETELAQFMFEFWWWPLFEKKWFNWIKAQFFWKWRFYLLFNDFLNEEDYYKITTQFVDNWDYESILVWYDLLSNRYVFSTIEELRHWSVVWTSWSWKTVWLISFTTQYLMKNNTDVIFIEKWTDLDNYLRKCERMIYKSNVEDLRYEHIISIFTYLNMELSRRKNIFSSMKTPVNKIQEYNKVARQEWKPFMKYMLLIIDEFSRLRDTLWNESKKSEEFFLLQLKSLIQVARSYWIFCMLATQNPTSEWWVPSNIQLNLSTKVLWLAEWASSIKYLTHSDERAVARQWKIRNWDFLFNSEWQQWMTITRLFKVDWLLDRLIEEWYIVPKTEEEQQKVWDSVDNYSNNHMNELIEELMKQNKDVTLLQTDSFRWYWIDTQWLDKISWIRRIAIILIINLLFQWYEDEVCKKIRETNLNPADFNLDQAIDRTLDIEKYQQLWFIFVLVESIYYKYLDQVIKTKKISKSEINKAKNWEDSSTESIEMYIAWIQENIVYNVNEMINRLI